MAIKTSTIARDIIAVIIIIGAVISFFVSVTEIGNELLRFLSGAVIGFYFAAGQSVFGLRLRKGVEINPGSDIRE